MLSYRTLRTSRVGVWFLRQCHEYEMNRKYCIRDNEIYTISQQNRKYGARKTNLRSISICAGVNCINRLRTHVMKMFERITDADD